MPKSSLTSSIHCNNASFDASFSTNVLITLPPKMANSLGSKVLTSEGISAASITSSSQARSWVACALHFSNIWIVVKCQPGKSGVCSWNFRLVVIRQYPLPDWWRDSHGKDSYHYGQKEIGIQPQYFRSQNTRKAQQSACFSQIQSQREGREETKVTADFILDSKRWRDFPAQALKGTPSRIYDWSNTAGEVIHGKREADSTAWARAEAQRDDVKKLDWVSQS